MRIYPSTGKPHNVIKPEKLELSEAQRQFRDISSRLAAYLLRKKEDIDDDTAEKMRSEKARLLAQINHYNK